MFSPAPNFMSKVKVQKEDYKFFKEKGDPGFSPERNKYVIEKTIAKYEANRKRKMQQFQDNLGERTEAVAMYFKHLTQGKTTPVEKYFGRRNLAYLQGQNIMHKLKNALRPN
jgi:hypothetical protein